MKALFYILAVTMAVGVFGATCYLGSRGNLWAATMSIFVSLIMMGVMRIFWEPKGPAGLYNPATQSWAFLFGDGIMLTIMLAAATISWRSLPSEGFHRSAWWLVASIVVGVVFSLVFRHVLNGPNFIKEGYGDRLGSPTSIWHDYVVYFSLAGSITYLAVPVILKDFTGTGWVVLAGFVGWLALGACDATIHPLEIPNLHPPKSETKLA